MVFGPVTLGDNTTLTTNATSSAGSMILGAVTLGNYTLTLQTGAVAGADITGTTASGLGTLALQTIGGTASFSGAVSPATLTVASSVNNAAFTGTASTITNAVTFSNTGTLTLGQAGGTQTYTGGLIATAPSTLTLNGTINTTNTALTLNAFTLGSAVTLNANSSDSTGLIKVGTITGASQNLTFASGYISAYSGSSIAIASSVNNVALTAATGTVNHQITFSNTGTLTLGTAGGTQTYAGGLIATAPSAFTLNGTLNSNSAAVIIGAVGKTITLGSNVSINTYADSGAGQAITLTGAIQGSTANTESLSLYSQGGLINLAGNVGSSIALGTLTLGNGAQTGAITVDGTINAQTLTAGASSGSNAFALTLNNGLGVAGTSTITGVSTFYNTGALRLGDYLDDIFNFSGGVTALASSGISIAAKQLNTTNAVLTLTRPITFESNSTISTGSGQIDLGAITLNAGVTLVLGNSGESGNINLSSITGTSGSGAVSA